MRRKKIKIDWDTVELVDPASRDLTSSNVAIDPRLFIDQRGKSNVKKILSGAAVKARAEGVIHTHVQLRLLLSVGMDTLVYGWALVAAAVEGDRDLSSGVVSAVHAIREASKRLVGRRG